jgi:hypothetical protein
MLGFFTHISSSNCSVWPSVIDSSSVSTYPESDIFASKLLFYVIVFSLFTSLSMSAVRVFCHLVGVTVICLVYPNICSIYFSPWWSWYCIRSASCTTTLARNGTMTLYELLSNINIEDPVWTSHYYWITVFFVAPFLFSFQFFVKEGRC